MDQLPERRRRSPAESALRFRGVAEEKIDLRRTDIARVDLDEHAAAAAFETLLLESGAAPLEIDAGTSKRQRTKVAHRVLLPGGDDEVFRLVLLQHEPHGLDVILCIAPVASRIQIAEVEAILLTVFDLADGARHLA